MYEYYFERGQLTRDPSPNQYTKNVLVRRLYKIQYPTPSLADLSSSQRESLLEYNTRYGNELSWIGSGYCSFVGLSDVALFSSRTGISWV